MFDIGWSEMALILLVALIVIGPKDLPRVARSVGQWVGKGRAMAREFQRALEDMAREAELDKVKSEIEKAGRTDIGKTIEKSIDPTGELSKTFDPRASTTSGAKRANGDRPAAAQTEPEPAASAPVTPTAAVPAGNGGSVADARKEAGRASAAAVPAKRKRRARAGNGAGAADNASKPARARAPAESS
jgi:sec-independent protein translocase protein TatB